MGTVTNELSQSSTFTISFCRTLIWCPKVRRSLEGIFLEAFRDSQFLFVVAFIAWKILFLMFGHNSSAWLAESGRQRNVFSFSDTERNSARGNVCQWWHFTYLIFYIATRNANKFTPELTAKPLHKQTSLQLRPEKKAKPPVDKRAADKNVSGFALERFLSAEKRTI